MFFQSFGSSDQQDHCYLNNKEVPCGFYQGGGGGPFGQSGGVETVDDVLCADQLIGEKDPMCGGWFGFFLDPNVAVYGDGV